MARVASFGVRTPHLLLIDRATASITMEYIDRAVPVRIYLEALSLEHPDMREAACKLAMMMGKAIAAVHNAGVIHGDLTTSNLLLKAL